MDSSDNQYYWAVFYILLYISAGMSQGLKICGGELLNIT